MDVAVQVSLAIFLAGVIYVAGMMSHRVKSLEDWRSEVRADFQELRRELKTGMDELKALIRGD